MTNTFAITIGRLVAIYQAAFVRGDWKEVKAAEKRIEQAERSAIVRHSWRPT